MSFVSYLRVRFPCGIPTSPLEVFITLINIRTFTSAGNVPWFSLAHMLANIFLTNVGRVERKMFSTVVTTCRMRHHMSVTF